MALWARGYTLDDGVHASANNGTVLRSSLTKVEVNILHMTSVHER